MERFTLRNGRYSMLKLLVLIFPLMAAPAFGQTSTAIQNQLIEMRNACLRSQIEIYRRSQGLHGRASEEVNRREGNPRALCEFGRKEGLALFEKSIRELDGMRDMACFDRGDEERIATIRTLFARYKRSVVDECRKAQM